ncbi:MAG: hypothetical protein PHD55_01565 [Methanoregula sp.]|jgi:hypothetical protein|nr:hypothetical protein [Methanoregula sp.]
MTISKNGEICLALLVAVLFILPCLMLGLIYEEAPYHTVAGEPVREAADAAGISVADVEGTLWNMAGATGGKTYTLTDPEGDTAYIATQAFDSAESRDAAVRLYNAHAPGKGKQVGSMIVVGQYIVYATPVNSPIFAKLVPALQQAAKATT